MKTFKCDCTCVCGNCRIKGCGCKCHIADGISPHVLATTIAEKVKIFSLDELLLMSNNQRMQVLLNTPDPYKVLLRAKMIQDQFSTDEATLARQAIQILSKKQKEKDKLKAAKNPPSPPKKTITKKAVTKKKKPVTKKKKPVTKKKPCNKPCNKQKKKTVRSNRDL